MMRAAGHLFARLVGALLATLLVAGTAAVVLLSSGPVALGPLRGELEAMLNPAGSRFRVALEDATLDMIADELGVSRERARQIRVAGEKKLRADFIVLVHWQALLAIPRRPQANNHNLHHANS